MRTPFSRFYATLFLVLAVLGCSVIPVSAQVPYYSAPVISLTGTYFSGWDADRYYDGRIWTGQRGDSVGALISVPVYMRYCTSSALPGAPFPITSFSVPVQYDSGAVEMVGVDAAGHASNFDFAWETYSDTSYMTVVKGARERRNRGMRVVVSATVEQENDSLRPTSYSDDGDLCRENAPADFVIAFSLLFRIKADIDADPLSVRTPIIITNDSLSYNGVSVLDSAWIVGGNGRAGMYAGLGGLDNHYLDANGTEQSRDPLRPSRLGMIWVEITEQHGSISFGETDTAYIYVTTQHQWADTLDGRGYVDVEVANEMAGTRISSIDVNANSSWLLFRSTGEEGPWADPFPEMTMRGTIPYLDSALMTPSELISPYGEVMTQVPPLLVRLYADPASTPQEKGRYVTTLSFTSTTMTPTRVDLPVVLIVEDSATSVQEIRQQQGPYMTISPNPSNGMTTFEILRRGPSVLTIVGIDGSVVEHIMITDQTAQAPLSVVGQYAAGVYHASLRTDTTIVTVPFIVLP